MRYFDITEFYVQADYTENNDNVRTLLQLISCNN